MSGLFIEKDERENSRQLVGRFVRALRRSGLVYRAKVSRYVSRPMSQKLKREAALRKQAAKERYRKMEKMGKL
ncbi:MAG: hypothetical protein COT37_00115 [Parcubacteria group bacterium CG08_land_8_20_14_0_20_43_9]|nr:MAG: hypothetical protein COT37_00115 [Parcubacteria group bacterium CG08_land_8_20_14_0_20_43_9]